ncbi:MAG: PAS domain S-box protein [Bacteroidia bacterium]|nr:PAS domain S-box protein [Bacteroidia bacterium]
MHRLLKRQLKKLFGESTPEINELNQLIELVDESYRNFQDDYNKLENILELSSRESFKELSNFKVAIDTAALVSLTDAQGNILMANENFCKVSGFPLGELIGKNHNVINSGFHSHEFFREMWQTIKLGQVWKGEICNRKKNGDIYWVDSSIIPFLNETGQPYQYLSIRFEISKRKKIEEEIKRLALVAQKTQNAVIITDAEGIAIWTNEGFERITGYSFDELVGKKPGHLLQGKDTNEETKASISKAIKSVQAYTGEILNYKKNGEIYWISLTITPLMDDDKHIGFIAIESDITEKKKVETRLKESEEKFRLLIESATDIFYYTDAYGNFTYVNNISAEITGFSTEELLQMNYLDLVQPNYRKQVAQFYLKQAKEGSLVTYFEFPIKTKSGRTAWIGQNVQLIKTGDNKRGIQAIARDITKLKDAQLEIESSHNFLNEIMEASPNPMFVKNREHKWILVNHAYTEFTQIDKSKILGKTEREFLDKEEAEEFIRNDEEQFISREAQEKEVIFRGNSGTEKTLLVKKTIVENGGALFLIANITDITKLKEQEKQVLLYNKIADQISDAISVSDYTGTIIYANEAHAKNLGKSRSELIGSSITEMEKSFATLKDWQQHYDEVKQKKNILIEGVNKRKDGSEFPVEAHVKYVNIENKGYIVAAIRDISERIQAAQEVKTLKEFYENVLHKIPSDIVVFDKEQRYLFLNELAIKDPVRRAWIVGKTDFEYCREFNKPIEMAESRNKIFQKVIADKAQLEFEEKVTSQEGKVVWMLRRFFPILDHNNEIVNVFGFGIDITNRKESEEKIKENEERLKLATSSANLGIWDWNLITNSLIWEASMYDIFGVEASQFKNDYEAFSQTLHPEDREKVQEDIKEAIANNEDYKNVFRIITKDGETRYIKAVSKTFRDDSGNAYRMIGVNYDVTETTLNQERLLKQQQDLEEAQHLAKVGGWEITVANKSIYWSKEIYTICDYPESFEPSLNATYEMFTSATRPAIIQGFFNAIEQHQEFEIEGQILTSSKKLVDIKVRGIPYLEKGKVMAIRGIFQDITQEKTASKMLEQYTADLEKKNKELDQFAYVVSHDLKAPLRGINNLSMWIEEDLEGKLEPDTKNNLDLMRKRVKRMEGLIDGILQYSRAGRIKYEKVKFGLKESIEELIQNMEPPSNFTIVVPENLPRMQTEKIAIEQVFANYISNAIKYNNNPNPKVEISFEEVDGFYHFCVSDNGPGIEKEFFEKIFVIFQTLQARDTFESTGVGLAIVKKMVEEKGGKVWLQSEMGVGTKFYFSWPALELETE